MKLLVKEILLSTVLLLVTSSSSTAFEWSECPDERSKLQSLTNVKLDPEPVPVGSTANFTIKGYSGALSRINHLPLQVERSRHAKSCPIKTAPDCLCK